MGFFSRSKITSSQQQDFSSHQHYVQYQQQYHHDQSHSQRRKVSFTDPPNVYLPSAAPRQPRHRPYNASYNQSQPSFMPAGYHTQPPPLLPAVDWTSPPGMIMTAGVHSMQQMATTTSTKLAKTVSAYDDMYRCFDDLMTMIDCENLKGHEQGLFSCEAPSSDAYRYKTRDEDKQVARRPRKSKSVDDLQERALFKPSKKAKEASVKKDHTGEKKSSGTANKDKEKGQTNTAANIVAGTYFSKVECYANAKLPADLPPLALYMSTWPLLCLAAKFSQSVYERPRGPEREAHVPSDWRSGTKAMRIKSVPMDSMNTIVFAIRGTASFMDWAVNLNSAPVSPHGFLDDPGNLCHQGFLSTARSMVAPVARRLADLLEENPNRSRYSLMITGHSAGGAVAALLYCHMLAREREARSELNAMTDRFKRVHCVTFGAPPVSLLPLLKPNRMELKKSIFMSFINEGDPVARAEKPYVKSLLELLANPAPPPVRKKSKDEDAKGQRKPDSERRERAKTEDNTRRILRLEPSRPKLKHASTAPVSSKPIWHVPEATLSNAGRLVILRTGTPDAKAKDRKTVGERLDEGVVAVTCKEEQLRGCVFGDPVAHMMALYAGRIETLAVGAVTGKRG